MCRVGPVLQNRAEQRSDSRAYQMSVSWSSEPTVRSRRVQKGIRVPVRKTIPGSGARLGPGRCGWEASVAAGGRREGQVGAKGPAGQAAGGEAGHVGRALFSRRQLC